jgi:AraC-like DNA-binding protein
LRAVGEKFFSEDCLLIAFLLGYAELNSFLRAFTVWTGKSVSEYRKGV